MTRLSFLLICVLLTSCAAKKTLISSQGLGWVQLGDELPPEGTPRIRGIAVSDTSMEEGDFIWRGFTSNTTKGTVVVEEEFFGSGMVARIRITSPVYKLRNKLHVGSTVAELSAMEENWFISPLPKFGYLDLYSRSWPRIHFLLPSGSIPLDQSYENYTIGMIPAETQVAMIVVF